MRGQAAGEGKQPGQQEWKRLAVPQRAEARALTRLAAGLFPVAGWGRREAATKPRPRNPCCTHFRAYHLDTERRFGQRES